MARQGWTRSGTYLPGHSLVRESTPYLLFYGGLEGDIKAKNSSAEKTPQENGDDDDIGR